MVVAMLDALCVSDIYVTHQCLQPCHHHNDKQHTTSAACARELMLMLCDFGQQPVDS